MHMTCFLKNVVELEKLREIGEFLGKFPGLSMKNTHNAYDMFLEKCRRVGKIARNWRVFREFPRPLNEEY